MNPKPVLLVAAAILAGAILAAPDTALAGKSEVVTVDVRTPAAVAAHAGRNVVYIASAAENRILVLNGATRQILGSIARPEGGSPVALAVDSQRDRLYDLDGALNRLIVRNAANGTIVNEVPLPTTPRAVALNPATNRIYVTSSDASGASFLSVIDGASLTPLVTKALPPSHARGIAIDPGAKRIFIALSGTNRVAVLNAETHLTLLTLPTGSSPQGVAVDAARLRVYVANREGNAVTVLQPTQQGYGLVPGGIPVPGGQTAVGVNDVTGRVYVAHTAPGLPSFPMSTRTGTLSVYEPGVAPAPAYRLVERITVAPAPASVAVNLANHRVFVASPGQAEQRSGRIEGGAVSVVSKFDPLAHGFHFVNSFSGSIPLNVPGIGQVNLANYRFGLCGGMSFGALDAYLAGGGAPTNSSPPNQGSPLFNYLYGRIKDSLLPNNAEVVRRFIKWMGIAVDDKKTITGHVTGLRTRTRRAFLGEVHPQLAKGRPVPLGLVKVDLLSPPWNNHQVLAIGDFKDAAGRWVVEVYDPNFPDTVTYLHIERRVQTYDPGGNDRVESRRWRGFFTIDYGAKQPYWLAPVRWPA